MCSDDEICTSLSISLPLHPTPVGGAGFDLGSAPCWSPRSTGCSVGVGCWSNREVSACIWGSAAGSNPLFFAGREVKMLCFKKCLVKLHHGGGGKRAVQGSACLL